MVDLPAAEHPGSTATWARSSAERAIRKPVVPWKASWPVVALLGGFPIFWALGLGAFAANIVAIPMAIGLYRRRPLKLPRGFALWGLFLVWTLVSLLVLGADPPGTIPDSAVGRLIGYTTREVSYASITILLLYIGNLTEDELPRERLVRLLGWFFVWTAAGGVLGMLAPTFSFTSPFELVLPHGLRSNSYVQHLVHPAAAQVQEFEAGATPRPSAPFDYTNTWGFHLTLLAIWFVIAWIAGRKLTIKIAAVGILAAGGVVLVYSLNRAAWLGVAFTILYMIVRFALAKRFLPVVAVMLMVALAGTIFMTTPLHDVVQQRLNEGKSDSVRAFTTERALELSLRSPIVGYGSTRTAKGSASSIAVGKSSQCPNCGNVPIGINGYGYMILMSTGWVGAFFFFGFGAVVVWRRRGDYSTISLAGSAVVVLTGFYSAFYDVSTWLVVPFVSLAILWRQDQRVDRTGPGKAVVT